jgi:pyruvate oxidase
MGKSVADSLIEQLIGEGVTRIYGIPGDAVNSIMDSIRKHEDKIQFVLVRHEENAAFMAAAEAKLTGRLAVCAGTAGPGAIHLLNGLYEAKMEGVPVLVVSGQVESDLYGSDYFQEVNLVKLFDDVASFNQIILAPEHAGALVSRAIRSSMAERSVSHINIPQDIARMPTEENFGAEPTYRVSPLGLAANSDLERAAAILNEAERPLIFAGKGARGASPEVLQMAKRLAAPIIKTLPAKDIIPDEHPYSLGGLGLLGTRPALDAMHEADAIFMIGTSYPYVQFLPEGSASKIVQLDIEPTRIGKRIRADCGLVGDSRLTLRSLLPLLRQRDDTDFLKKYQGKMKDWWSQMNETESSDAVPIRPERVARELSDILPKDSIISVDVGNVTVWMARDFRVQEGQIMLWSGWLATMGVALPSAIAAKFVHPERPVIAAAGDGGFCMTMSDFVTAVRHKLPLKAVVFDNRELGMIRLEQEIQGHPKYGIDLVNPDFARYAEACGGLGLRAEKPSELKLALEQMMETDKPCVVDVMVDQNARPMHEKVSVKQAANYVSSLFREKFG